MTLIVQDPLNPTSTANSYQSLIDARALAANYAITLPVDDAEAEASLINAMLYSQEFEPEMCGSRTTTIQNTAYPRADVHIRNNEFPSDEFPLELLLSNLIAAESFWKGVSLFGGADDGKVIASEKVDVIAVSYFDNGKTGDKVSLPRFNSTIKPLLCCNDSVNFRVSRG